MAVAAVFILGQADFKRMLAYSSVEHMGILVAGRRPRRRRRPSARMLHAVNHSLTKAMLFLVAGNILAVYRSKSTADVRGVLRVLPVSGVALDRRLPRHHRLAAVRPVPQRVHDPEGRARSAAAPASRPSTWCCWP